MPNIRREEPSSENFPKLSTPKVKIQGKSIALENPTAMSNTTAIRPEEYIKHSINTVETSAEQATAFPVSIFVNKKEPIKRPAIVPAQ